MAKLYHIHARVVKSFLKKSWKKIAALCDFYKCFPPFFVKMHNRRKNSVFSPPLVILYKEGNRFTFVNFLLKKRLSLLRRVAKRHESVRKLLIIVFPRVCPSRSETGGFRRKEKYGCAVRKRKFHFSFLIFTKKVHKNSARFCTNLRKYLKFLRKLFAFLLFLLKIYVKIFPRNNVFYIFCV